MQNVLLHVLRHLDHSYTILEDARANIHTDQNHNLRYALKIREIFEKLGLGQTLKGLVTACAQLHAQLLFLAAPFFGIEGS